MPCVRLIADKENVAGIMQHITVPLSPPHDASYICHFCVCSLKILPGAHPLTSPMPIVAFMTTPSLSCLLEEIWAAMLQSVTPTTTNLVLEPLELSHQTEPVEDT